MYQAHYLWLLGWHYNVEEAEVLILQLVHATQSIVMNTDFSSWLLESVELKSPYVIEVVRQPHWSLEEAVDLVVLSNYCNFLVICVVVGLVELNLDIVELMEERLLNLLPNLFPFGRTFLQGLHSPPRCFVALLRERI